ncbi:MAG: cation:proton antiporter [Planctomycetaceae bacterium]
MHRGFWPRQQRLSENVSGRRNHRRAWRLLLWVAAAALLCDAGRFLAEIPISSAAHAAAATATDSTPAAPAEHVPTQAVAPHPAQDHGGGHTDPVAPVLAGIVIILLVAKIGGDLFERIGLPAVLGELTVGILLGNAAFISAQFVGGTGWHGLDFLHPPETIDVRTKLAEVERLAADQALAPAERESGIAAIKEELANYQPYNTGAVLKMLAGIGVILLLFEVGLESTVRDMLAVGASSFIVATLGVVAPMILGYGVGMLLIPQENWQVHLFLGATLCATSVGITARVLKDLGRSQQPEARIVLGAAVIDDVMGLIVLAVVQGIILSGSFEMRELVVIIAKSLGFLGGAVVLGTTLFAKPLFKGALQLRGKGMLVASGLVICFVFSWLANLIGLAPIVGAFAAGLILERAHYHELGQKEKVELEVAIAPIATLLVPIFFVQMGISVDLKSFLDPSVWALAAAVTFVAILGKQVCAFGVLEKGLNRLAVGVGMIPRGEVGLIFAAQGAALRNSTGQPVVNSATYSAIVVMVILTTMITPPVLKIVMNRRPRPAAA